MPSSRRGWLLAALALAASAVNAQFVTMSLPSGLPGGYPQPVPTYMKNNYRNQFGVAPDKGTLDEPVLEPMPTSGASMRIAAADNADDYWLSNHGPLGRSAFGPMDYQFFRNVKDFGAVGDGVTDDTAALERAVGALSPTNLGTRCGKECGSTTHLGAVVYFPPGTYIVSRPIIQYFHTQFVGNPNNKAVIKGSRSFKGIALIDANPYIPQENGRTWFVNQSNFFRQVRNLVFDMRGMRRNNYDGDQEYVPTGIHWTVGQATSISNCDFLMDGESPDGPPTSVGIMMENGSGGSVSDLTFQGGNIGFLAGSQQFTATNLKFTSCITAVRHEWNWGFVWKNIHVYSCWVAFDCTAYSESTSPPQGTGSISVIDSYFQNVPTAIKLGTQSHQQPNIVLDNLLVESVTQVVLDAGGKTILAGSASQTRIASWVNGFQASPQDTRGGRKTGPLSPAPSKPASLIDGSNGFLYRSKPQYEDVAAGSIVVATANGISNEGFGDQTAAINSLLSRNVGRVIFFPGGTYLIRGTIEVPVGSKIIGSGWSSFMATGSHFQNEKEPKPLVRVGKEGDSGVIEITDMLFTTKGRTPGCIVMEWNVRESTKGSAAMWDSHFRIGGGAETDLLLADCPARALGINENCMAASMLLHLTKKSSGFFDNVWVWVADHDLEDPLNAEAYNGHEGIPTNVKVEISIYVARGVLIEAKGPTWFWGSASEHCQLYQWQIFNATQIFLGHMQTETPYYQPNPGADKPYEIGLWPEDPTFDHCDEIERWPVEEDDYGFIDPEDLNNDDSPIEGEEPPDEEPDEEPIGGETPPDEEPDEQTPLDMTEVNKCKKSWALRILYSEDVFIYSAGFYSFFDNNGLGCAPNENCQTSMIETQNSAPIWLFNVFTKGNKEIIRAVPGRDSVQSYAVLFSQELRGGYTSEMAAWLIKSRGRRVLTVADGGPELVGYDDLDGRYNWDEIEYENRLSCLVFKGRPPENMREQCKSPCLAELGGEPERTYNYGCAGWFDIDKEIPWERAAGNEFAYGRCVCDNPLVNELTEMIMDALPLIAQIGCFITMSALKLVVDVGLELFGVGRALSAAEDAVLTAVQMINYVYPEGEDPFGSFEWWLSPCGDTSLVPEEIRRAFDIMSQITGAAPSYRQPRNIPRNSGKKGDSGNPTDRSTPRSGGGGGNGGNPRACNPRNLGDPEKRMAMPFGLAQNTMRYKSCRGQTTVTNDLVITSLLYAPNARPLGVTKVCPPGISQACYHYSSAVDVNPGWATLTCPQAAATSASERDRNGPAVTTWARQHPLTYQRNKVKTTLAWRDPPNRDAPECQIDEYPPLYLLDQNDQAFRNSGKDSTGQLIRYLPAAENRAGGRLWQGACFGGAVDQMQDDDFVRTFSNSGFNAVTQTLVRGEHTVTYKAVTVTQRPEFSFDFVHPPQPNHGHRQNPCWPSGIAAGDPYYPLLTYDPAYNGVRPPYNYRAQHTAGSNGS